MNIIVQTQFASPEELNYVNRFVKSAQRAAPPPRLGETQGAAKLSGLPAPVGSALSGLLGRLETADILLIAVLLLLYLEKKDKDLLITLAALVFFSLG